MKIWKSDPTEQKDRIIRFKQVFGTPEGKAVLRDLMNSYHILNHHDGDPFKEGQRSVVLSILNKTNQNMELFEEMMKGDAS